MWYSEYSCFNYWSRLDLRDMHVFQSPLALSPIDYVADQHCLHGFLVLILARGWCRCNTGGKVAKDSSFINSQFWEGPLVLRSSSAGVNPRLRYVAKCMLIKKKIVFMWGKFILMQAIVPCCYLQIWYHLGRSQKFDLCQGWLNASRMPIDSKCRDLAAIEAQKWANFLVEVMLRGGG